MQASSLLAPKFKGKKNILELPLPKGKAEVSLSAFGYLFMEVRFKVCRCCLQCDACQVVSFAREGATSIPEIETRLTALGRNVGVSFLEFVTLRDKGSKREVRHCITSTLFWPRTGLPL
jgi:hypothetical protein